MRSLIRTSIRNMLVVLGYRTSVPVSPVTAFELPTDAIYWPGDVAFEVQLAKCYDPGLFFYGAAGWNPMVETLREYGSGKHRQYKGSILQKYNVRFRPKTQFEMFFEDHEMADTLLRGRFERLSLHTDPLALPWSPASASRQAFNAERETRSYGPAPEMKEEAQFARYTRIYDSIKTRGYKPTAGPDGDIRGQFLRRGNEYRFLVRSGMHRMAALAALGYERVRVKFRPHCPRSINLSDIGEWPKVKAGILDEEMAEAIFMRFFGDGGIERAKRLGLLSA